MGRAGLPSREGSELKTVSGGARNLLPRAFAVVVWAAMSDSIKDTQDAIRQFREERDWKQFHDPRSLAVSVAIEAGELLEQFQWVQLEAMEAHVEKNIGKISEEIADVADYLFGLADVLGIDLLEEMRKKRVKNAEKYPVEKTKGRSDKYDTYQ